MRAFFLEHNLALTICLIMGGLVWAMATDWRPWHVFRKKPPRGQWHDPD
jgi:hypothetical protein